MHAKYSLFDTSWVIETANWTRASFGSNREFFIAGDDASIYENLSSIFLADFAGGK
jgi:phosphatidylserine/phosphatidylglycerophosphate/cardiolipin synthase-like enzyme